MPSFDIVRTIDVKETYRVARVLSDFDMDKSKGDVHFHGNIEIPENWNVGLIYGASGTGKTTLVKELFPDAVGKSWQQNLRKVKTCSFKFVGGAYG